MQSFQHLPSATIRGRDPTNNLTGTAPCVTICPLGLNVPGLTSAVASGDFATALDIFRDHIPFPSICAHLCDHPCQPVCARAMEARPVPISFLEKAIVRLGKVGADFPRTPATGFRVAIVGAGPAGLTAAHSLGRMGHEVTIFHSGRQPCGSARRIPDFRLARKTLEREVALILDQGILLKSGFCLGRDFTLDDLKADGFHAVILAFGLPGIQPDHIPGDDLSGVMAATDFLQRSHETDAPAPPGHVVVAGDGIEAVDAARLAARQGADSVTMVLCHSLATLSFPVAEIQRAQSDAVQPVFLAIPAAFEGRGRRVEAVVFQKVAPSSANREPGRQPVGIPGTEFRLPASLVLLAPRGHGIPDRRTLVGLSAQADGRIIRDEASGMTCLSGVFVCGELAGHGGHAVQAMADGRRVAHDTNAWLRGAALNPEPLESTAEVHRSQQASRPGTECRQWDVAARLDSLLEGSDTDALASLAIREAQRCLRCRRRAATDSPALKGRLP